MGLFSSSGKNKQDRALEDSGRFYSKDDDAAVGERARSKRASNAGGGAAKRAGNDPMLPEKKRARRRLVGAIALALAAAVGLPMLLDSEPKPLAGDIAIQIPAKDKAAPLPVPGEKAVSAEDSVDKGEEVVTTPTTPAASAQQKPAAKPDTPAEPPAVARVETAKPEHKPEVKADAKPDAKLEHKDKERLAAEKAEKAEKERLAKEERLAREERLAKERADKERVEKERAERLAKARADEKDKAEKDKAAKARDDTRALAILEDKPGADKAKPADAAGQKFVLQVAALSSQEKAAEVQAKLRDAGISSYTQKATTSSGELIRVRVGPLSRDEAEKVRAKLGKLGLSGTMTPV